jgi:kinesin family protein C1
VGEARRHAFVFHRALPPTAGQADVFGEVDGLVQSALDGHRACIFAYGQTGSGKTYTMMGGGAGGGDDARGIIPRAAELVFARLGVLRERGWEGGVTAEMLEIHNEVVRDLLPAPGGGGGAAAAGPHDIRHDKDGNTSVTGLTVHPVASPSALAALTARAVSARATAATASNAQSSRSHCVFTLRVTLSHAASGQSRRGLLHLVDLAGSERIAKSGVNQVGAGGGGSAALLGETQAINSSLFALSKVIMALQAKAAHVPYRDSKLTYLLQHSLGGGGKTVLLANLAPLHAHAHESLCTLRFAEAVARVAGKA